jgi:predicted transcriptional regulator
MVRSRVAFHHCFIPHPEEPHTGLGKHRDCTEIAAHILQAAKGGATRTRILHEARLSTNNLAKYMDLLIDNDLLQVEPIHRRYSPTGKGDEFLQIYEETITISKIIDIVKKGKF